MSHPLLLIIDDYVITRETLTALLSKSGYEIKCASSGAEGLELASELNPDVVLLDVMMPVMDGFEVCRKLRSDPNLAEIPIIMITALDDQDSRLMGLEAGADDFLSKPFNTIELEIRLRGLRQVARYRHLREEREKLQTAHQLLQEQNEELRMLSAKVISVQEIERRHLAMELHDEIGQQLTALKILLINLVNYQGEELQAERKKAINITEQLLTQVRELTLNLRPTMLDDLGLIAALYWFFNRFTQQTKIKVIHNIDPLDDRRFPDIIETTIFRVIQEALTNIARHARVNEVMVTLNIEPRHLRLSIVDSGKGFNIHQVSPGHSTGISSMRERVSLAGGKFNIQSTPGEGTIIEAEFSLPEME